MERYFISLLLLITISCKAQLVHTIYDLKNLEINKNEFIGKPLKDLLQQIKPEIKRVRVIPGSSESLSTIYLSLLSDSGFHNIYSKTGKRPAEVCIRLKEHNFKWWNPSNRPQNHRFDWTKNDEKEFGKLTVEDIRITATN